VLVADTIENNYNEITKQTEVAERHKRLAGGKMHNNAYKL